MQTFVLHLPHEMLQWFFSRLPGQYISTYVCDCLICLVVKASASRAEDRGFESHLRQDFSRVESYQQLKNWHSNGYPARRLAL